MSWLRQALALLARMPGWLLVLCLWLPVWLADRLVRKRRPGWGRRLDLGWSILLSLLSILYCGLLVYAIVQVLTSAVSTADKVTFLVFMLLSIGVFVGVNLLQWRRWWREKRPK